jgi:transcriptional regulator of molybdate metabolism, LysR family
VEEAYFLACLKSTLDQPATRALLVAAANRRGRSVFAGLPGYAPMQSGEVLSMSRVLPWWRFGGRDGEGGADRELDQ